jgi:hypothetical protein
MRDRVDLERPAVELNGSGWLAHAEPDAHCASKLLAWYVREDVRIIVQHIERVGCGLVLGHCLALLRRCHHGHGIACGEQDNAGDEGVH